MGIIYFLTRLLYKDGLRKFFILAIALFCCINLIRQLDFKDDLKLFTRALKVEPQTKEAYEMLGLYYLERGQPQKAWGYYQLALKPESRYFSFVDTFGVYNNLGVISMRFNSLPKAIDYFKKALSIRDEALAHLNLYLCYKKLGDLPQAEKHLAIAINQDPGLAEKHSR